MLTKTICIFIIFSSINIYPNVSITETFLDNTCLTSQTLNLDEMDKKLKDCREKARNIPIANVEERITITCENFQNDKECFEKAISTWKRDNCLKPGKEKLFTLMLRIFDAARLFRCKSHRALFKGFLTKGQSCISNLTAVIDYCTAALEFVEPWVTLETLRLQTETPYTHTECWQKGLWAYCVTTELNDCGDKTALQYYKGLYGAMLIASPCKELITKQFPALHQVKATVSSSFIWLNDYFLAFLCFLILISV